MNRNKARKQGNFELVFLSILFLLILIVTVMLNRKNDVVAIGIGKYVLESGPLNGLITVMANLVTIIIVLDYQKKGLIVSTFLLLFQIVMMIIPIVKFERLASVPGIAMAFANYAVLRILNMFLEKERESKEALERLVKIDTLTEVPNRRYLFEFLNDMVSKKNSFAVIYLDVDNFKGINDSLGHEAGDFVLRTVAQRYIEAVEKDDFVARIGGDEFAIVLNHITEDKVELRKRAQKIAEHVNEDMIIQENHFKATVSIGIACFPDDGTDTDTMLQKADVAMYGAKKNGKSQICIFDETMLEGKKDLKKLF